MSETRVPPYVISIKGVTKAFRLGLFKKKTAVRDLSVDIASGKVVGLIGPNGSGKSTTLKMILGFLSPTKGEILICGASSRSTLSRRQIGYLPENPRFQKFLKAGEVLQYYGRLLGLTGKMLEERVDKLLELVDLQSARNEKTKGFSKGMIQRLAIAQALLAEPSILLFDEPMSGLDPLGRLQIRNLISDIHQQYDRSTILFSSHVLSDVESICGEILLLRNGEKKKFCSVEELCRPMDSQVEVVLRKLPNDGLCGRWSDCRVVSTPFGQRVLIQNLADLPAFLTDVGVDSAEILSVESSRHRLEASLFSESEGVCS